MFNALAFLTHSVAALIFLIAGITLVFRRTVYGAVLPFACLVTALWATLAAFQAISTVISPVWADLVELARSGAWIALLIGMLELEDEEKKSTRQNKSKLMKLFCCVAGSSVLIILYSHIAGTGALQLQAKAFSQLSISLLGMLLVEQSFRNATEGQRWNIKFFGIATAVIFVYDFYLYSDAMLFLQTNETILAARGAVLAFAAPLIVFAAFRRSKVKPRITLSRNFIFHSVSLTGAAIYLLGMASAGYYIRYFGGTWGTVVQAIFLCGAAVLLAVVMFSGTFRAWLKVSISKNFYSYHYDYREEWIRFTKALSEKRNGLGERAIQVIGELVHSNGGSLWIVRESGNCEPAAHWNMFYSIETEPSESGFCKYLEQTQWIIDLDEQKRDPGKYEGLALPAWILQLKKAWLIVPLLTQGKLFGFIILAEPRSKINLNWEVLDLLKIAGNQAASYLAQDESMKALLIARQFESFNRMSTFVVHDLKNLVAQLSLLVSNAERHKDSPEFQKDMLETVAYSADKMKSLLQKFNRTGSVERPAPIHLGPLLTRLVAAKSVFQPQLKLHITDSRVQVFANAERLERVVSHIVQNALEAIRRDGQVTVRLDKDGDHAVIEIEDNGQGMSDEFIAHRLFRPFESTKVAGMGIGLYEMNEYITGLGGNVNVKSELSKGTKFTLSLPMYADNSQILVPA